MLKLRHRTLCRRRRASQGYSYEELFDGEQRALETLNWTNMSLRFRSFRNGLVNVALEHAPLLGGLPNAPLVLYPGEAERRLHVLVVDSSQIDCDVHRALVQNFRPQAQVSACHRSEPPTSPLLDSQRDVACASAGRRGLSQPAAQREGRPLLSHCPLPARSIPEALSYMQECDRSGSQVHLILLDLSFNPDGDHHQQAPTLQQVCFCDRPDSLLRQLLFHAPPPPPRYGYTPPPHPVTPASPVRAVGHCSPHRSTDRPTASRWPLPLMSRQLKCPPTSASSRTSRSSRISRTRLWHTPPSTAG